MSLLLWHCLHLQEASDNRSNVLDLDKVSVTTFLTELPLESRSSMNTSSSSSIGKCWHDHSSKFGMPIEDYRQMQFESPNNIPMQKMSNPIRNTKLPDISTLTHHHQSLPQSHTKKFVEKETLPDFSTPATDHLQLWLDLNLQRKKADNPATYADYHQNPSSSHMAKQPSQYPATEEFLCTTNQKRKTSQTTLVDDHQMLPRPHNKNQKRTTSRATDPNGCNRILSCSSDSRTRTIYQNAVTHNYKPSNLHKTNIYVTLSDDTKIHRTHPFETNPTTALLNDRVVNGSSVTNQMSSNANSSSRTEERVLTALISSTQSPIQTPQSPLPLGPHECRKIAQVSLYTVYTSSSPPSS